MTTEANKLKLLYLQQIFHEETDKTHGLTMPQIISALEECGVTAERKAIYRDIQRLRDFGLDIEKRTNTSPTTYGLGSRAFSDAELMLLADAVQTSRFLTARKAKDLVAKIKDLGTKRQTRSLSKRIHVERRISSQNESVFTNVDTIQQAISMRRKIEFLYFKHDAAGNRKLQHDGDTYIKTPVHMIYSDGFYYCTVWDDKHVGFSNYRIDRMADLCVSAEAATRNESIAQFNVEDYQARQFGMFNGKAVQAKLLVEEGAVSAVLDRFGTEATLMPRGEGHALITTYVMDSPTFYGWLAQFGTAVTIEGPQSLKESYVAYLRKIVVGY